MPAKLIVKYRIPAKEMETRGMKRNNMVLLPDETTLGIIDSESNEPNEWDQAHELQKTDKAVEFAEPDVDAAEPFYPKEAVAAMEAAEITETLYNTFIAEWPAPEKPDVWHIADEFTGLKAARKELHDLTDKKKIRIAHLDTGYDEEHQSFPKELVNLGLSRSFVEGEDPMNAEDRFSTGILANPGHGLGTMSILAGKKMSVAGCTEFDDYVGLEEAIEIVPIRISKSVVLFKSAAFVKAMDYILNELNTNEATKVHIITMSMGGLASRAWADVVNEAYEQGIFMVTAAGNNFNKLPTRRLIFPARFNRVVAACGVTYDLSPYAKPDGEGSFKIMEGNHGPRSLMKTAIAAFTPNVPWAIYKQKNMFGIRGDGTSSATPQVAAAAALYYSKYYKELEKLSEPWMIVEAIRFALFESAAKTIAHADKSYDHYYGNGILQAKKALSILVPDEAFLSKRKQKKDSVFLPFIRLILGLKKQAAGGDNKEEQQEEMLETELMQLSLSDPEIQKLLDNPETDDLTKLTKEQRVQLALLIQKNPKASKTLQAKVKQLLQRLE